MGEIRWFLCAQQWRATDESGGGAKGATPCTAPRSAQPQCATQPSFCRAFFQSPRFRFKRHSKFCVARRYQIISKTPTKRNKAILEPRFMSDTSIRSVFCSLVRFSESKNQFWFCTVTEMWTLFMRILVKVSYFIIN